MSIKNLLLNEMVYNIMAMLGPNDGDNMRVIMNGRQHVFVNYMCVHNTHI